MAALVVFIGLSVWLTHKQVAVWKNDEALFGHAVTHQPGSVTAQTNMASYYRVVGNGPLAMHHYQMALKILPYDHIANYNVADIHYRNGDWQQAKEAAIKVTKSVPRFDRAHYLIGIVSSDTSKPEAYDPGVAFKHYERAYQIAPENPKYAFSYARQLAKRKRQAEALEILKGGIGALNPQSPWYARFQKGIQMLSR